MPSRGVSKCKCYFPAELMPKSGKAHERLREVGGGWLPEDRNLVGDYGGIQMPGLGVIREGPRFP